MNNPEAHITPEYRECFKCKYQAVVGLTTCPRCGKKLYTSKNIRNRGFFLIFVGLFLAVFMGAIAVFVASAMSGAMKNPESAQRINNEVSTFLAIYALFGILIAFGLHSIVIGVWQVIFGRRSRVLIWIMWALLFVMLIAAGFLRGVLG